MPKPKYSFRSTDNECEAVMASILTARSWKGKFRTVAGINPDYSYGRDNWAAFLAIMKKSGIEVQVVSELWPKLGATDFTAHVAAPVPPPTSTWLPGTHPGTATANASSAEHTASNVAGIRYAAYATTSDRSLSTGASVGVRPR